MVCTHIGAPAAWHWGAQVWCLFEWQIQPLAVLPSAFLHAGLKVAVYYGHGTHRTGLGRLGLMQHDLWRFDGRGAACVGKESGGTVFRPVHCILLYRSRPYSTAAHLAASPLACGTKHGVTYGDLCRDADHPIRREPVVLLQPMLSNVCASLLVLPCCSRPD